MSYKLINRIKFPANTFPHTVVVKISDELNKIKELRDVGFYSKGYTFADKTKVASKYDAIFAYGIGEDFREYPIGEISKFYKQEKEKKMATTFPEDLSAKTTGCGSSKPINDPWIHRSDKMKCKTCMWFVEKKGLAVREQGLIGRCRRHAPTTNGYPVVFDTDWCGDHKLDEMKP